MPYRALRRVDVGLGYRDTGEVVPEAESWPNVHVLIAEGILERVQGEVEDPGDPHPIPGRQITSDGAAVDADTLIGAAPIEGGDFGDVGTWTQAGGGTQPTESPNGVVVPDPTTMRVGEIEQWAQDQQGPDEIEALLVAEQQGKNRKTARVALEERLAELKGGSDGGQA